MKTFTVALSAAVLFSAAAFAGGTSEPSHAVGVSAPNPVAGVSAPNQKVVAYGDLNLGSQDGVVALRNRIVAAAVEVCAADAAKASRSDRQCRDAAVKNAINEIGRRFSEHLASAQ